MAGTLFAIGSGMRLKTNKHRGFPMGNRLIALVLTIAGINLCAWGQTRTFQDTDLPGAGKVSAIAQVAGPSGSKLIGTSYGRIFRSTDRGASWHKAMGSGGAPVRAFQELTDGTLL